MERKKHMSKNSESEREQFAVWGADNWSTLERLYENYLTYLKESNKEEDVDFCGFSLYMFREAQDVVHMASIEELWNDSINN